MVGIDIDRLLQPVPGDTPCGPNLQYDLQYFELESAVRVRAEQQYGDVIIPAQLPDWNDVLARSVALLARTKDLRVAVYFLRAATRTHGWAGLAAGLKLVRALMERHWDSLHPQPDSEDGDDATMRLNAIKSLVDTDTVLADVRAATPDGTSFGLTTRDIELAWGESSPIRNEFVPSQADLCDMLSGREHTTITALRCTYAARDEVSAIDRILAERFSAAPFDLMSLSRLVWLLTRIAQQVLGDEPGRPRISLAVATGKPSTARVLSADERREAYHQVRRVCDWLHAVNLVEQAPVLIRRSQRLAAKNFADILQDVAPNAEDPTADLGRKNES